MRGRVMVTVPLNPEYGALVELCRNYLHCNRSLK